MPTQLNTRNKLSTPKPQRFCHMIYYSSQINTSLPKRKLKHIHPCNQHSTLKHSITQLLIQSFNNTHTLLIPLNMPNPTKKLQLTPHWRHTITSTCNAQSLKWNRPHSSNYPQDHHHISNTLGHNCGQRRCQHNLHPHSEPQRLDHPTTSTDMHTIATIPKHTVLYIPRIERPNTITIPKHLSPPYYIYITNKTHLETHDTRSNLKTPSKKSTNMNIDTHPMKLTPLEYKLKYHMERCSQSCTNWTPHHTLAQWVHAHLPIR